jgi:hypothetical protein
MFPGYIFVRFVYPVLYRRIAATSGVAKTLSFGGRPAILNDSIITDLRRHVADEETIEINCEIKEGEEIRVIEESAPLSHVFSLRGSALPSFSICWVRRGRSRSRQEPCCPMSAILSNRSNPWNGNLNYSFW